MKRFLFYLISASFSGIWAAPSGIQPKVGEVTCKQNGKNTQIVASHNSIIHYQSFDIGKGESVEFVQPSSSSRVYNKILSAEPSRIDGAMRSNGIVYVVNPSGIIFGKESVIDVGGFFAAAAHLADEDFLAGKDRFSAPTGSIIHEGKIVSSSFLRLLGNNVEQKGSLLASDDISIFSSQEEVIVGNASGHTFMILSSKEESAEGDRSLAKDIYALAIRHTGDSKATSISIQSREGDVKVEGSLSVAGEIDGEVFVSGNNVNLSSCHIDASGDVGGGKVYIGGLDGGKGSLPVSQNTFIDSSTLIQVSANECGDAGKVIVWSEGTTTFGGIIEAKGGPLGGNGGFVEVSGKKHLNFQGRTFREAPLGMVGTLLLDPYANITISEVGSTSGSFSGNPITYSPGSDGDVLQVGSLNAELLQGDVIIKTDCMAGSEEGDVILDIHGNTLGNDTNFHNLTIQAQRDVIVSSPFIWKGQNLELNGSRKVDLSKPITISSSEGSVVVAASSILMGGIVNSSGDVTLSGPVVLAGNTSITSSNGRIAFTSSVTGMYDLSVSSSQNIIFPENVSIHSLSSVVNAAYIPPSVRFNKSVELSGNLIGYYMENESSVLLFQGGGDVSISGQIVGKNLTMLENDYNVFLLGGGKIYNDAITPIQFLQHRTLQIGTAPSSSFESLHDIRIHGPHPINIQGAFVCGGHVIFD